MSDTTADHQSPAEFALSHHAQTPNGMAEQMMPAQTHQYAQQETVTAQYSVGHAPHDNVHPGQYPPETSPADQLSPQQMSQGQGFLSTSPPVYPGPTAQYSVGHAPQDHVHPGQYPPETSPADQLSPQQMSQGQGFLSTSPPVYPGPTVYPGQALPVHFVPSTSSPVLPYNGQQSYYVLRLENGAATAILVTLDISYIKSIRGLCQFFLFITLTVAWSCCLEVDRQCRVTVFVLSPDSYKAKVKFAMFAFTSGWIMVLLIFMTRFTQLHNSQSIAKLKWPILCLILHSIWMVFTLIAAALLASEGKSFGSTSSRLISADVQAYINNFWAATAFGFISWALFLVHLYFYFAEYNQGKLQAIQQRSNTQVIQSFEATLQEVPSGGHQ